MTKILFSVNMTDNENIVQREELYFVSNKIDVSQEHKLQQTLNMKAKQQLKASIPIKLTVIQAIAFFAWVTILAILSGSLTERITIAQAYKNAPVIIGMLPISFIIWLFLFTYERLIRNNVKESPEFEQSVQQVETVKKSCLSQLGVPEDAVQIDIIIFYYEVIAGKISRDKTISIDFINQEKYMYIKDNELFIADLKRVVKIPLNQSTSLEKVNKKIAPMWNKKEEPAKGEYTKYKIRYDNGMLNIKPYYIAHIDVGVDVYDLYIPAYDILKFINLTGLTIDDEVL
ncbi:hypothetical protein KHQ81_06050 [Mycoplasmatota bacterium]|nr:hypothetical protein KHQ81_06050 [Mycoplasmatota bacterium]